MRETTLSNRPAETASRSRDGAREPDRPDPGDPLRAGLSVVIPCFNEADGLDALLDELLAELADVDLEVICVDDGSVDGTLDVLRRRTAADPRIQYLSFTRNFGVEAAFSAGYLYARMPWLVHLDADGQFPPREIRRLVAASEGMDAVFGVRAERHDPLVRRVGSGVNQLVARRMLGIELPPRATCFRLVRTEVARAVVELRLGSPYFLATLPKLTDRHTTVPVDHRPRTDGPARVRFFHLAAHALDLWFGFSRRPAAFATIVAMWAAAISVVLGLLHITRTLPSVVMEGGIVVLVGVALFVIAVEVRCLGVLAAGQARPRQFYVREASIAVLPADTFQVTAVLPTATPVPSPVGVPAASAAPATPSIPTTSATPVPMPAPAPAPAGVAS